jgi:protein-S-isoprenylcysteine O-methyltransferase Ste14
MRVHIVYELTIFTYIGMIMVVCGRVFSFAGARILHHNPDNHLVTRSIFKWSRNPITFGLFSTFCGMVLIFPFPLMILGWIIFLLSLNYKVNLEEKFLLDRFGSTYITYQRSTPKYLFV